MLYNRVMLTEIEKTLRSHPFVTQKFLQNSHLQTLLPKLFPSFTTKLPPNERKFISLPDGSQIAADCFWQKDKTKHATIIIFDGFGNSGKSNFSQRMAAKAFFTGYNVINLSARGTGDTVHLTKELFDIGIERDPIFALQEIIRWGIKEIYLIGYSAGGYYVLQAITQSDKNLQKYIKGAVAMNTAVNAYDYIPHLESQPFYHWVLLRVYKNLVKRRLPIDPKGKWDKKKLKSVKTIMEFRHTFLHNLGYPEKFSSLEDYYQKSDLKPLLKNISVPTLIINAKDDPIVPLQPFLSSDVQNNPSVITLFTENGGHGGFFSLKTKYGDLDGHWAQNRAMEFIQLLEKKKKLMYT